MIKNVELDRVAVDCYLVRVGTMSGIGRFRPSETGKLSRGDEVICRSHRGLEAGRVLGRAKLPFAETRDLSDGRILRKMTPEDRLLWTQLCRLSRDAADECSKWLSARGLEATLLEVEPLIDGKTLYFHFLADISPEIQQHIDSLVNVYRQSVLASQFAKLLENGCGPGCGTDKAANSCGSKGGCAICKVAGSCAKK